MYLTIFVQNMKFLALKLVLYGYFRVFDSKNFSFYMAHVYTYFNAKYKDFSFKMSDLWLFWQLLAVKMAVFIWFMYILFFMQNIKFLALKMSDLRLL